MVVWQGITAGGTAVPVQLTEDGKVVAIGEQGPQGPEGPPGPGWPPNPVEGAFLVWLNGEPTWYAESPVPTPPGVAGPITEISDNSLLTFAHDLDQSVFFKNVNVYAVNADGSNWNGNGIYDASNIWSGFLSSTTGFRNGEPATNAFDGSTGTVCSAKGDGVVTFTSPKMFPSSSQIRVWCGNAGTTEVSVNGGGIQTINGGGWATIEFKNPTTNPFSLQIQRTQGADTGLNAIEIGGQVLLNPGTGPAPHGQISAVTTNTALLSRVGGTWSVGEYMKADEGLQAAWLVQKNKRNSD